MNKIMLLFLILLVFVVIVMIMFFSDISLLGSLSGSPGAGVSPPMPGSPP